MMVVVVVVVVLIVMMTIVMICHAGNAKHDMRYAVRGMRYALHAARYTVCVSTWFHARFFYAFLVFTTRSGGGWGIPDATACSRGPRPAVRGTRYAVPSTQNTLRG